MDHETWNLDPREVGSSVEGPKRAQQRVKVRPQPTGPLVAESTDIRHLGRRTRIAKAGQPSDCAELTTPGRFVALEVTPGLASLQRGHSRAIGPDLPVRHHGLHVGI